MRRPALVRTLWALLLGAALVLLVKAFVADVYRVDSVSMEPTIHGSADDGELVLVRYDRAPELARFDLVVILRDGEREPVVKRVVGLPGETVRVHGDLFIDGKRLGPNAARPELIPVFDSDTLSIEKEFTFSAGALEHSERRWTLQALHETEYLAYQRKLVDDHFAESGARVEGLRSVGDGAIEVELAVLDLDRAAGTRALLGLTEEGDSFELELALRAESLHAVLRRSAPDLQTQVLAECELAWHGGPAHRARFSNVDNVLAFDWDGERALETSYEQNRPMSGAVDETYTHRLPRARLGVAGGVLRIDRLCILRDLDYTEAGRYGTTEPTLPLGPDEIFVLGDNSAESRDSREWGPLKLREVIGRPVAVVWPAHGIRRLAGAEPPPPRLQGVSQASR